MNMKKFDISKNLDVPVEVLIKQYEDHLNKEAAKELMWRKIGVWIVTLFIFAAPIIFSFCLADSCLNSSWNWASVIVQIILSAWLATSLYFTYKIFYAAAYLKDWIGKDKGDDLK